MLVPPPPALLPSSAPEPVALLHSLFPGRVGGIDGRILQVLRHASQLLLKGCVVGSETLLQLQGREELVDIMVVGVGLEGLHVGIVAVVLVQGHRL